jgi:hypothetical protein
MTEQSVPDLLLETIEAHDPGGHWPGYRGVSVRMTARGDLWDLKGVGGLFDDVHLTGATTEAEDTITPFTAPDRVGVFTPERIAIMTTGGDLVEERTNPLESFAGQERTTPWDELHALYFASYANWNYLVAPFIYAAPGFSVRENGTWEENGAVWRRLEITYPEGIAAHCRTQEVYIDGAGLITRLDYSMDVLGGMPAAHYPTNYQMFDGIFVPTRRTVYTRNPDGTPDRTSTSIDLLYSEVHFS